MKQVVESTAHESTLTQWRGAQAKIWAFHVTHNRLAICLTNGPTTNALYIVAMGCKYITGPFKMEGTFFRILKEAAGPQDEPLYRLVEENTNFQLLCSDVRMAIGAAGVPESPFENFLED